MPLHLSPLLPGTALARTPSPLEGVPVHSSQPATPPARCPSLTSPASSSLCAASLHFSSWLPRAKGRGSAPDRAAEQFSASSCFWSYPCRLTNPLYVPSSTSCTTRQTATTTARRKPKLVRISSCATPPGAVCAYTPLRLGRISEVKAGGSIVDGHVNPKDHIRATATCSYAEGIPLYLSPKHSGAEMMEGGCYICAALTAGSVEGMVAQMEEARVEGAHVAELRLDHIRDLVPERDLPELLTKRILPVIVTFRPKWEGGQYGGEEEHRQATLLRAVELGADFVDVELQVAEEFLARCPKQSLETGGRRTRVIVSSHNYDSTPSLEDLSALAARIQASGADVVKIATTATDITDVARIFKLIDSTKVPTIALCMGSRGQISRLLAPKFGAFLTFGSLGAGKESAPGQLTVRDLAKTYRLNAVGRDTMVLGVVGNPIVHSKSPLVHNAAMIEAGVDGVYVPYLVDDVRRFLRDFASPDFAGFSVTIPHKQAAMECCDEVDPIAKLIGAVNTVVRRSSDGKLVGYNTDWLAAIEAIENGLRARGEGGPEGPGRSPLEGRTVVLVGAGGAGRAIGFGAKQRGARVLITNRNSERAKELASAMNAETLEWSALGEPHTAESLSKDGLGPVLAQTTSVGMVPNIDNTLVPKEALRGYSLVFDAVYTPMETRLLREAVEVGATAVSGVEMFIGQAEAQFTLFTGVSAPKQLIRDVVLQSLTRA